MKLDLRLLWLLPASGAGESRQPRAAIDRAVQTLEAEARNAFPQHDISVSLAFTDHYVRGAAEMRIRVDSCHLAIVDATHSDPDVMFAMGLLTARDVPVILIEHSSVERTAPQLSLANFRVTPFESYDRLPAEIYRQVVDTVRQLLHRPIVPLSDLRAVWFPEDLGDVYVIAALEDQPTPYTNLTDRNYIHIDNLIDRDTLLGVYGLLRRFYPASNVILSAAEPENAGPIPYLENNMVVVGGPGVPDEGILGNYVCRLMTEAAGCSVAYNSDGETAYFNNKEWTPQYTADGIAKRDFGYFSRFANPFNPRSSVVMLHGLHTLGVLGAFRAFSDHPRAYANITRTLAETGPSGAFEAGLYVDIHSGAVLCPTSFDLLTLGG